MELFTGEQPAVQEPRGPRGRGERALERLGSGGVFQFSPPHTLT